MKRINSRKILIISFLLAFILAVFPAKAQNYAIDRVDLFSSVTVTAGSSFTSGKITLDGLANLGYFSLQILVTGNGTAKFEYLVPAHENTFLEPSGASDIASGFTKTSGPGSDGKDRFTFNPDLTRAIKIKVTETGALSAIVVSAFMIVQ